MKKIIAILILFILIIIPSVTFAAEYKFEVKVTGTCDYDAAYEILRLTNEHRARNGLPALTMDKNLLNFAMQRAAENSILYSHTRPNNTKWYTGYPYKYSNGEPKGAKFENIAIAQYTAYSAFTAWKNSSGHNAAMLDSTVKSIGIGAFYQPELGRWTWVQIFSKNSYSSHSTGGTAVKTFTVPVSTAVVNLAIYSPDESFLSRNSIGITEKICPGKSAEYGIAAYNGYACSKIDPSSYTITKKSGNISINGNKVTANGEGTFSIQFNFNGGVSLSSNVMSIGHTYDPYGSATKEPTCTESGYSSSPCTECGYVSGGSIIPALGHSEVTIKGYAATCTEDGLTDGKVCERCSVTITPQTAIPATGHNMVSYTPEDPVPGVTYRKCTGCEKTSFSDPFGKLNDEIYEIYSRGAEEADRERLETILLTYNSSSDDIKERFTNYPLLVKMLALLDGMIGDVNNDGKVNALDATQILRYANNKPSVLEGCGKDTRLFSLADVNGDGKVNALDATQILRYANNKSSVLDKYYA